MKKPEFKVGDYVKCIDNSFYEDSFILGEIRKVHSIQYDAPRWFVSFDRVTCYASRFKIATVKNTAVARAFYKNRIDKIEGNLIYLK